MKKKIRIAFVGGGWIMGWHVQGLKQIPELCEVVAVAEVNEAGYPRIRELLDNPDITIYKDYNEMYEKGGFDAAIILLPHFMHVDAAVKAAEHGYHVLTEKVMARNTYECQQMIDACRKAGVKLGVAHDRRYSRDWMALKRIVDSGVIGDVTYARFEHNGDSGFPKGSWLYPVETVGGGAMASCMTHQLDGMRWLCGEAESVYCVSYRESERMEGDIADITAFRLTNGGIATVCINWMTQLSNMGNPAKNTLWYEFVQLTGTKGDAYFVHNYGTFLKVRGETDIPEYQEATKGDFVKVSAYNDQSGHTGLVENFVKMLLGEPNEFSTYGEDTIKTVELAEASYISAHTRKEVILPIEQCKWEDRIYLNEK